MARPLKPVALCCIVGFFRVTGRACLPLGPQRKGLARQTKEGEEKPDMEVILFVVLVLMLVGFGYAQYQRGVVRTVGKFNLDEDEKRQPLT
jgi:hypothetical protein